MDEEPRSRNGVRPEDGALDCNTGGVVAATSKEDSVVKNDAKAAEWEEKGVDQGHDWESKKNLRRAMPQVLATSAKNMLLLAYGMTLGFPTIVIPSLQDPNSSVKLTQEQISWFSSINLMTVPLGCIISGTLTVRIGKTRAMIAVNIPFLVSWSLFYWASTPTHLYSAMVLSGLAGGLLEAPVLTYVAEITEPHLQGFLSATASSCVILRIFLEFLFGSLLVKRQHYRSLRRRGFSGPRCNCSFHQGGRKQRVETCHSYQRSTSYGNNQSAVLGARVSTLAHF